MLVPGRQAPHPAFLNIESLNLHPQCPRCRPLPGSCLRRLLIPTSFETEESVSGVAQSELKEVGMQLSVAKCRRHQCHMRFDVAFPPMESYMHSILGWNVASCRRWWLGSRSAWEWLAFPNSQRPPWIPDVKRFCLHFPIANVCWHGPMFTGQKRDMFVARTRRYVFAFNVKCLPTTFSSLWPSPST